MAGSLRIPTDQHEKQLRIRAIPTSFSLTTAHRSLLSALFILLTFKLLKVAACSRFGVVHFQAHLIHHDAAGRGTGAAEALAVECGRGRRFR